MKKPVYLFLLLVLLIFVVSCNNETDTDTESNVSDSEITDTEIDIEDKIERITEFPHLKTMGKYADEIGISYNANGKFLQFTITDEDSIRNIMSTLFKCTFKNVGTTIPSGGETFRLDIKDGEEIYVVSECMLYNGYYYEFRDNIEEVLELAMFPPNDYLINGCQNSVNPTRVDKKQYYKQLRLGAYLGKNVPTEMNDGLNFDLGIYYDVILNYEDAQKTFTDLSDLEEGFFDVYYIFVIGAYMTTSLPYDIHGFYNMYYDSEYDMAKISFDGKSGLDVTTALSMETFYLKIPKTNTIEEYWDGKTNGKLDWDLNTEDYIDEYHTYSFNKKVNVKEGTAWLLTNKEEINEFGDYYGITPFSNWQRDTLYFLVIYMKKPCQTCFNGFKDLHTDGKNIYLTAEETEYKHNHAYDDYCFVTIEIPKKDSLYTPSSKAQVTVLFEENKIEYID